jgi:hypothetical protein
MSTEKDGAYPVEEWVDGKKSTPEEALETLRFRYSEFTWIKAPSLGDKYGSPIIEGVVKLNSIENYAQVMADQFGWTYPDARIFYRDGSVKEIFSYKVETPKKKGEKIEMQ